MGRPGGNFSRINFRATDHAHPADWAGRRHREARCVMGSEVEFERLRVVELGELEAKVEISARYSAEAEHPDSDSRRASGRIEGHVLLRRLAEGWRGVGLSLPGGGGVGKW